MIDTVTTNSVSVNAIPMDEDDEIDTIKEYIGKGATHNVKLSLLNIVIVLRREAGLPTEELKKLRTPLAATRVEALYEPGWQKSIAPKRRRFCLFCPWSRYVS